MAKASLTTQPQDTTTAESAAGGEKAERREIKGGIPYSTYPGTLKKALDGIIAAERPDKFTPNFMETILGIRGGAARSVPPLFKKMQFLGPDGSPTQLYSKFKTEGGRSQAAFEALRNAFSELFRRNEYIYKADESAVKDILVEITGLKRGDQIIRLMYTTFEAIKSFVDNDPVRATEIRSDDLAPPTETNGEAVTLGAVKLGLSYQINIVLPETENIAVFNAIFKSLRENLLR